MPLITANGATLDYFDSGPPPDGDDDDDWAANRPPVVLIHGWLGTWEAEFAPEIEWLRPHYRVLAVTRRGYGTSGPKPRRYPRDFYRKDAQDIAAWLDALGVTRAHILGFSDGGEVALLLPILRPDLTASVVAWGAVGYFPPELRAVAQKRWPPTWVTDEIRQRHPDQEVERMVLGWINGIKQIIDTGGDVSLADAHRITCPLLMMLGGEDDLNPAESARQLVARAADARLEMFDGGHHVHRLAPDHFRALVWEHLQRVDNGA